MRTIKLPKTFMIFVETADGRSGYIRLRCSIDSNGDISYMTTLTGRVSEASLYLGLDGLKVETRKMKDEMGFIRLEIVDSASKKRYIIQ